MFLPFIILVVLGFLMLVVFVPYGGIIMASVTFAVVILQYLKTHRMHQELQEIRKHLGVMKPEEEEEYDIKRQINEVDHLGAAAIEEVNQKIEEELANTADLNKKD
ncbi:hypothetical protein [Paenibacillus physcomitrellae]|uniref:Uncharacterized protein n=1 Tax=Paenibacillus physcomitrellae TaxID=1619311 RepID=A0ABQ1GKG6_9BACL|nr:hypothetical protein [Paenibacillus physcomitrellae]GGA45380.1 hypothetical protein GCM10010917_33350 [Paenibacillus physcomitrellae]